MLRAVLDTVVFVRALINPKSRCGRLFFDRADDYELVASPEIIREVLEVIHRPEIASRSPHFNEVNFQRVLDCFRSAEVVEPSERVAICRDPADDKFIECALAGHAGFIVSEDKDLLDIGEHKTVRIVDSNEFIMLLDGQTA